MLGVNAQMEKTKTHNCKKVQDSFYERRSDMMREKNFLRSDPFNVMKSNFYEHATLYIEVFIE